MRKKKREDFGYDERRWPSVKTSYRILGGVFHRIDTTAGPALAHRTSPVTHSSTLPGAPSIIPLDTPVKPIHYDAETLLDRPTYVKMAEKDATGGDK
jgi:hypothetical protein